MQFVKIQDPNKPGDYLVVSERDFDASKHKRFEDVVIPPGKYTKEELRKAIENATGAATGGPNTDDLDTTPDSIATVNSEIAFSLIASADTAEELDALEAGEKANQKKPGGRVGVLRSIEERRQELAK